MLPATTKEQRGPMYRDLERLISPGFLSTTVRIGGVPIGVRSLGPNDLEVLRSVVRDQEVWPLWVVASSIWTIDGRYLLDSHPTPMRPVFDRLRLSHRGAIRALFSVALSFFDRYREANRFLEPYLYEESSRRLWGAVRVAKQTSLSKGYPGASRIGTNPYQEIWLDWNRREDGRLDDEYAWSLTKVVVSMQSSKAANKLDSKDKTRLDAEKSRRSSIQDRAYYVWKGVVDREGKPLDDGDPSRKVFMPRTNEELAEEMRRWVAGEKDFHDLVVDDYVNRVRSEVERQEAEKERALREAAERRAAQDREVDFERPALVALTPEQVENLTRSSKGRPAGVKFIREADPVSRLYNRYVRDLPDPGNLQVVGDRVVPYTDPSTGETPPRPSLNDRLSSRKPTLDG